MVVLSFFIVKPFLEAILLGALLAYIAYPVYKLISKKINSPTASSLIVCLLVLLILVIPFIFLIKIIVEESYLAFIVLRDLLSSGLFTNCQGQLCQQLQSTVQNPIINSQVQQIAGTISSTIVERGSQLLLAIPKFVLNLFVMFFTLFYFLKDGKLFLEQIKNYLSMHKKEYSQIMERLGNIVHGVVFGYIMVALIQGALGALGFFLFGISSPLFWGLLMALLALIPVLGTGFVWVPASVYLLLEGIFTNSNSLIIRGAGLFLYGLLLISTVDNILKPKLIGNKAKTHSVIVMVGIFGGLLLFGPLGVFIGPLVLSFTSVIIEIYLSKKKK